MVGRLIISALLFAVFLGSVHAQNYSVDDTVYEYPNKGTFYHDRFEGRKTASGEVFDQNKFTAAHWKIKLGTFIMVTNRNTGLQVIVKVNDRCPKRGVIDMSHRAAAAIGIRGCQPVTVRILPTGYEERWAAQETLFDSIKSRISPRISKKTPPPSVAKAIAEVPPASDRFGGYNLLLGTVTTHGEAFTLTQRLPEKYREQVSVDSLEGSNMLRLTLETHQPRQKVDQLRRSLKEIFPQARVVVAD